MPKTASVQENDTHKILRDFEIKWIFRFRTEDQALN